MKKAAIKRSLPTRTKNLYKHTASCLNTYINTHPMRSFFGILGAILILIIVSNILTRISPKENVEISQPKTVSVYRIGSVPKITVTAKTRKSGVVQISSLTNGIVSRIYKKEGDRVQRGELLASLSTNYQGSNPFTLQRQIAEKQYQTALDTYSNQKDLISIQKDLSDKNKSNSDKLRDITNQAHDETQNLINLNHDILTTLDNNINTLSQNSETNSALILSTKQLKSQFLAATNQAQQILRANDYSQSGDNPPAQIAGIAHDIAIKQLDIQQKQLDMNKEISGLALAIARINESMMFPTSPFSGIVQRVNIIENQLVSPGNLLMTISQTTEGDPITAVAFISQDTASRISKIEPSILHIGNKINYESVPSFVSTEAVQGTLFAAYYDIPEEYTKSVVSEGFISIEVPIGVADTTMSATYIPIDAVYQTRDKSYVFVAVNDKAKSKNVVLGQVYGRFVEIVSGLKNGDAVILNRDIISDDLVKIQ